MKKLAKLATSVTVGLSSFYWAVVPAFALGLCPVDSNGANFSSLCNSSWNVDSVISTGINVLLFVAFVAALGFLIYGGIRWIMSGGDKEGTAKAKGTVTSALIGLVIVLASWILLNVITNFFHLGSISNMKLPSLPTN